MSRAIEGTHSEIVLEKEGDHIAHVHMRGIAEGHHLIAESMTGGDTHEDHVLGQKRGIAPVPILGIKGDLVLNDLGTDCLTLK